MENLINDNLDLSSSDNESDNQSDNGSDSESGDWDCLKGVRDLIVYDIMHYQVFIFLSF